MALSARTVMVARAEPEKSCSSASRPVPGPAEPATREPLTDVRVGPGLTTHE